MHEPPEKIRVDKWLWQARFFKSRAIAAGVVEGGIRIDGARTSKPARTIAPGVTLTFAQARRIRVIKVLAIGTRRGPAPEARALYEDLTPEEKAPEKPGATGTPAPKFEGSGRPSKKDRRELIKSKRNPLE